MKFITLLKRGQKTTTEKIGSMKRFMAHGDLYLLNLNPYVNKFVVVKFIEYKKLKEKIKDPLANFGSYWLVYDKFYDKEITISDIDFNCDLLMQPHKFIYSIYDRSISTFLGKSKIQKEDIIYPDLRTDLGIPKLTDYICTNEEHLELNQLYGKMDYEVFSFKDNLYQSIGNYKFNQCGHLDFNKSEGSPWFGISKIYMAYLKKYEPLKLSIDLFGNIPKFNRETGENDDREPYRLFAHMNPLHTIPDEYKFKVIPEKKVKV